jgi:hypothetical protein
LVGIADPNHTEKLFEKSFQKGLTSRIKCAILRAWKGARPQEKGRYETMTFTDMYFFDKMMAENPSKVYISIAVAIVAVIGSIMYELLKKRKNG